MALLVGLFVCWFASFSTKIAAQPLNKAEVLADEDVCVGTHCALNQLQTAGAAHKKKLATETFADSASVGSRKDEQCSILAGSKREFPTQLIPGNYNNNMRHCKLPDQDLSGVWWLWWSDSEEKPWKRDTFFLTLMNKAAVMFYNLVRFEILLTFAGCSLPDGDKYPAVLEMQIGMPQQWSYGVTPTGRAFQFFAYILSRVGVVDTSIPWAFENSTYATAVKNGYEFIYLNENQWLRPTALYIGPVYGGTFTYVMTRVVDADGKKTEFWDKFEKKGANYRTWAVPRDDFCRRSINGFTQMFFLPLSWGCSLSNFVCR